MTRIVAIGKQNFANLRENNCFYVDKTRFIRDWWNGLDDVTLITRPRRFGKTLMLDTIKTFFSPEFAGRPDLFEGLEIWGDEKFHDLQGKIPVIFLSFAKIKNNTYDETISRIKTSLTSIYDSFMPFLDLNELSDTGKKFFTSVNDTMTDARAQDSLHYLCKFIAVQKKVKPIILLDEYDTPFEEAWLNGYWDELVSFMRNFFNATFKDNTWIERALITGITRVAKESIFSDMNNLEVITTTSTFYTDCFGFTEQEVFSAMDEYGLTEREKVKQWYDGFIFGRTKRIYNPWSIINYLKKKEFIAYWANSSSNAMVGELIAQAEENVKEETRALLRGESIITKMDEEIVFSQLEESGALWSFLMATGYVKPINFNLENKEYELSLTNHEVHLTLTTLISNWFKKTSSYNKKFLKALLSDNLTSMNINLKHIAKTLFSFFDTSGTEPERFYHGFVLGLIVDLKDTYKIKSNRESGDGRYDVTMFPRKAGDPGIVIEFKTLDSESEKKLETTCRSALKQILKKNYITELLDDAVISSKIFIYGFAFSGKDVLICGGAYDQIDWQNIAD